MNHIRNPRGRPRPLPFLQKTLIHFPFCHKILLFGNCIKPCSNSTKDPGVFLEPCMRFLPRGSKGAHLIRPPGTQGRIGGSLEAMILSMAIPTQSAGKAIGPLSSQNLSCPLLTPDAIGGSPMARMIPNSKIN